ncbi:C40 family peptidase [Sphingobacterium psychroaquaticum]|nr:C40 family peptidase [Sphingobacterium psychroaquaticum]
MDILLGRCNLTVVPLRAEASHRSEMVSQVLFGEEFVILQEEADWAFVRLHDPVYEGWIQKGQYVSLEPMPGGTASLIESLVVDVEGATARTAERVVHLVPGTKIMINDYRATTTEWFEIEGKLRKPTIDDFDVELKRLVTHYKDTPYLWGGRSDAGIDCSGLTLACYRHFGIDLPRDAYQQAELGEVVDFLSEIKAGDLAFFDNADGKITHVGMMLDAETILHASARVRVDKMDSEGIFNKEWNRYTHKLRIVKRYW